MECQSLRHFIDRSPVLHFGSGRVLPPCYHQQIRRKRPRPQAADVDPIHGHWQRINEWWGEALPQLESVVDEWQQRLMVHTLVSFVVTLVLLAACIFLTRALLLTAYSTSPAAFPLLRTTVLVGLDSKEAAQAGPPAHCKAGGWRTGAQGQAVAQVSRGGVTQHARPGHNLAR